MGEAVMIAGIGCRKGVTTTEVLAAVDFALAQHRMDRSHLSAIATPLFKDHERAIDAAARELDLPLTFPEKDALNAASSRALTRSGASLAATGLASVAETAALAAAGAGGRLLGPRIVRGPVTCALAVGAEP